MRIKQITTNQLLLIILGLGLIARLHGLNWDQGFALHPDERMVAMVTSAISWHQLNPQFFNYGHLPIYLLKMIHSLILLVVGTQWQSFAAILLTGRLITIFFEIGTIWTIFQIGRTIKTSRTGLIGAFLYAFAPFAIQNSHFYIVDPLLTFWTTLTILLSIKLTQQRSWKNILFLGVTVGAALATKFSGLLLVPIPFISLTYTDLFDRTQTNWPTKLRHYSLGLLIFFFIASLTFVVTQPYIVLNLSRYWNDITAQLQMAKDASIFPYTRQFIHTTAYLYPIWGITYWGLGIPTTGLAILGVPFLITELRREKGRIASMLLLVFFTIYFGFIGQSAVKFMRYYLPLYPLIIISAALALDGVTTAITQRKIRATFAVTIATVLMVWPLMTMNIYNRTNPRIVATDWINTHLPTGSTIAVEHWDDTVPLRNENQFQFITLEVYNPENPEKWQQISAQLDQADYIIISSDRVYKSILAWPEHYPQTVQFYHTLFAGTGNYQEIKRFQVFPYLQIGSLIWQVNDQDAPSSWTIFDHPTVMIFAKTPSDNKLVTNQEYTLLK